ncbi:MAG TPA: acyltransferase [Spirochaetota bacterium]|nr:acyltransferase [Spirochaetota bacterium]HPI89074.1 acyltransferase [Spirochaetota bacterium]HPR48715.1 acyltransferase [Spirochaetota bacterium]
MLIPKRKKIRGVRIYRPVKISGINNIEFGNNIIIDSFCYIYANKQMKIGNNVHLASFVFINGADILEIGDFAGIFQGVKIYTSNDDFKGCGFGNPTIDDKYRNTYRAPIIIGRFSVIGANSVVLPGVTIGEGASVGACSVVTRNLDPWGIYIGNEKVGERNRDAVLQNYKKYLEEQN